MPTGLKIAISFAVQFVVGAVLFLTVIGVTVAVNLAIHWLERLGFVPNWLSTCFPYVEMIVWGADMVLYALFVVVELVKSVRKLWATLKEEE